MSVTSVSCRHDAVEEIDPTVNRLDNVPRSADAHKVSRLVLRHMLLDRLNVSIASELGTENVYWEREKLRKAFEKKYKNKFVYAKAQSRGTGADEEFYFEEAYEVSGFDYDAMIELLEQGRIYIDLRIGQYANGKTHDHGTGFRIREIDQPKLFKVNRKVV